MNELISLNDVVINREYIIYKVLVDDKRFYNLGIIENSKIKALYKSPFGNPTAFFVKGSIVAIRNDDAKLIIVRRY